MSIELTLLNYLELSSGCTKKLEFPVPDDCDAIVQFAGWMAGNHFLTWIGIGLFFIMLFSTCAIFFRKD